MPLTRTYWITAVLVLALAGFLVGYTVGVARSPEPTPVTIVTTTTSSTWPHLP